ASVGRDVHRHPGPFVGGEVHDPGLALGWEQRDGPMPHLPHEGRNRAPPPERHQQARGGARLSEHHSAKATVALPVTTGTPCWFRSVRSSSASGGSPGFGADATAVTTPSARSWSPGHTISRKRTRKRRTEPGPNQAVMKLASKPAESIPWARTPG